MEKQMKMVSRNTRQGGIKKLAIIWESDRQEWNSHTEEDVYEMLKQVGHHII